VTSLLGAVGKPVIDRDSAEQIGEVRFFAVDAPNRQVTGVAVVNGRRTSIVDWSAVQSVGPDAVIVGAARESTGDDERLTSGAAHPLGKRVLSDLGNELGQTTDAEIDDDGVIQVVNVGDDRIDGSRLRGVGSYAVVIAADPSEA
jgi:sporulation protein YlmC with PRC-barrel domain